MGTVLLCLVTLTLVLFTAVSAGVSHLRVVQSATTQEHARNLADAALSKAISRLVETDFEFGKGAEKRIEVQLPDLQGATGTVTFDPGEAGFSDAFSSYNLDTDSAKPGARGRSVPGRTVHLVGRGKVGDVEQWMECYYFRPPFPDGLASTGWVDAKTLYLAGVRRGQAYNGGDPEAIPPEETFPANLFSNAPADPNTPAVRVRDSSKISGSAGAVGNVSVETGSVVEMETLPLSEPRPIPDLDMPAKILELQKIADPNQDVYAISVPEPAGKLGGFFYRFNGPLSLSGGYNLNGNAILVDGDLTISGGGLKGFGMLLVDGNVTIQGGQGSVNANDQVAIGCTGDFLLQANGPSGQYFQGLVYCEGDFKAENITVVGATVVHGKGGAEGTATLDNVRFVYDPGSVQLAYMKPIGLAGYWDGFNSGFYHSGVSAKIRPNPSGQGWLCDIWACVSTKRTSTAWPAGWKQDDPTTWEDYNQKPSSKFFAKSWKNIPIADPTGVKAEVIRLAGPWMTDLDGLGTYAEKEPDQWKNYWSADSQPFGFETGAVSFNLNSLFADLMSSSRVLLWRPFQ